MFYRILSGSEDVTITRFISLLLCKVLGKAKEDSRS
jgi:hypothetical protein